MFLMCFVKMFVLWLIVKIMMLNVVILVLNLRKMYLYIICSVSDGYDLF